ncbi:MAG: radical SAM protein [Nitrosarchaeum sp.]|nr:radical SAM protein [Nitrosarchaeum sp.]
MISTGCHLCARGLKSVLLITGKCPRHCSYCPLSENKYGQDVTFINEWQTSSYEDIKHEIELCQSKGIGITGGDPLLVLDRTCSIIKALKKDFGAAFHIHLYTSLNLFVPKLLTPLHEAGLDEIRVHPDLDNTALWERIKNGKQYSWSFGMEIPCIPGKEAQTRALLTYAKDLVDFTNLNELEFTETNAEELHNQGLQIRDDMLFSAAGSSELAKQLMQEFPRIHFCTARFKDAIQMKERILLRAKSIARPFDIITEEGMIKRGAIYLNILAPGLGYRRRLVEHGEPTLTILKEKLQTIKSSQKLTDAHIELDASKFRLICSPKTAQRLKPSLRHLEMCAAIVEEYPTHDALEVEVDYL